MFEYNADKTFVSFSRDPCIYARGPSSEKYQILFLDDTVEAGSPGRKIKNILLKKLVLSLLGLCTSLKKCVPAACPNKPTASLTTIRLH